MSEKSAIEWTDTTWNPVRGCDKVSPGCKHCYAEAFAERWRGVPGHPYTQGFDLRLVPEKLDDPLRWQRPRQIFVNSMSDLFHVGVPEAFVDSVVARMVLTPRHTYQLLTKRSERMRDYFDDPRLYRRVLDLADDLRRTRKELYEVGISDPRRGMARWIWLGVSVEDRRYGLPRIDNLRETPAGLRFLSIEPLLEDLGELDLSGIGWVIVGGESGLGARPLNPGWVRSIRDQCVAARVPFFFKQWGGIRKKVLGRLLDGRTWDEMPAPSAAPPPRPHRLRSEAPPCT